MYSNTCKGFLPTKTVKAVFVVLLLVRSFPFCYVFFLPSPLWIKSNHSVVFFFSYKISQKKPSEAKPNLHNNFIWRWWQYRYCPVVLDMGTYVRYNIVFWIYDLCLFNPHKTQKWPSLSCQQPSKKKINKKFEAIQKSRDLFIFTLLTSFSYFSSRCQGKCSLSFALALW